MFAVSRSFVSALRCTMTTNSVLSNSNGFLAIALQKPLSTKTQTKCPTSSASGYRYTLDTNILSKEQRDFYEQNGYIVIKNLVAQEDLDKYITRFNEFASGARKPRPELLLQKEVTAKDGALNENSLYKIGELYADDILFGYCKYPKILDYVEAFVGPNIMAIHTMLINKPPDSGSKSSRHPLHQDLHYFPMRPAERIVCAWTALERVTRENGCLVAIPGSHNGPHLEHDYPDWEGGVNKFYYGIKDLSLQDARVHLEMGPGDTVFFHPILIHGSGMNRTAGFRKAISCHYAPAEANFIDVRGTIQEKLANEVMTTFLKKYGTIEIEMCYATLWKLRARLVRGAGEYHISHI